jgi:hypothetical protein
LHGFVGFSDDDKLDALIAQTGNSLRDALSGPLRPQLLAMLDDVKKNGGEIYAALYELNDPELIPALVALGQKCHLILARNAEGLGQDRLEDASARPLETGRRLDACLIAQRPGYQYAACGFVRSTTTNWLANTR